MGATRRDCGGLTLRVRSDDSLRLRLLLVLLSQLDVTGSELAPTPTYSGSVRNWMKPSMILANVRCVRLSPINSSYAATYAIRSSRALSSSSIPFSPFRFYKFYHLPVMSGSQSWISAAGTTTSRRLPNVSTTIWRLRPLTFLPASKPRLSPAQRF